MARFESYQVLATDDIGSFLNVRMANRSVYETDVSYYGTTGSVVVVVKVSQ